MSVDALDDPHKAARFALEQVTADPERAAELAARAGEAARRAGDPAAESTALRALGLAAREHGEARDALRHLRRAVRAGARAPGPVFAAQARMSLALMLMESGRPTQALAEIEAAAPHLDGLDGTRLRMQRALILDRLGHLDVAMAEYTAAIQQLSAAGDRLWLARALTNRGNLHIHRPAITAARLDLLAAHRLYRELGQQLAAAQVEHNLGYAAACAGDLLAAIHWYDRADDYFRVHGRSPMALIGRSELFLQAQLLPEAREAAQAAVAEAQRGTMRLHEAQARLMYARIALADGDPAGAMREATAARQSFARQRFRPWTAMAQYLRLRADTAGTPAARLRAVRAVAAELADAGLPAAALDARLFAASLAAGRPDAAEDLRVVLTAGRRGPAALRARAWHAAALLRDAAGDTAGARRALLAGIRVLDAYQAALGATELRSLAGSYAADLITTGVRLALRGGRPAGVLWWAERRRAVALRLPPTRPPREDDLAADLDRLRGLASAAPGGPRPGRDGGQWRAQRAVEERIRRRSWQAAATGAAGSPTQPPRPAELTVRIRDRLAGRTLIELVNVDGTLHAVAVGADGCVVRPLGPVAAPVEESTLLRFSLRRLLLPGGTAATRRAAAASARHAAHRLDALVLAPMLDALGSTVPAGLVLVPAGPLHATPWALTASCWGRPLVVAPSATAWLAADTAPLPAGGPARPVSGRHIPPPNDGPTRPGSGGHILLAAGPGLAHAEPEVRRLRELHPAATVLLGERARAEVVRRALDGARLAHLAAHGAFRSDNAMFSHVLLADGPFTVYDIERLARPPQTVVLSACDVGLSAVHPGEELMGLTSALLGLGTATVLASVLPARDAVALELMVDLHRRLAAGARPAAALAAAQVAVAGADGEADARLATAAAFGCYGSG
ncbi:tetratricopeptide (TPR) repeat protein [Actinoplanes octamycinicus]|uniref:Tetratricopeptide (TPR) repeat protein n=1 Tax=Actinoplanes octamycinicus TaxID=135948 RepID=A0A7W7H0A4_9ACTN|nr:tetratricopeptide (TPR) repeat protein [Actinoplanes octamycinicus]GIE57131.1 CHAT domain-containing protein [Actinoplanes octamycinicus]